MRHAVLAMNARFFAVLRRLNGGRLPGLCNRFPNRVCSLLPRCVRGDLVPGIMMEFDLDDEFQRALYLGGRYYEAADIDAMAHECVAGNVMFIDIGANVGIYTFSLLARLPTLAVCAFEPNPRVYPRLCSTAAAHDFPNLTLVPMGLSDACGVATLHASDINSGWSTFGTLGSRPRDTNIAANVVTFDSWWDGHVSDLPRTDRYIIKLDVEGFEARVLRGMRRFLAAHRVNMILIELFDAALRNPGRVRVSRLP